METEFFVDKKGRKQGLYIDHFFDSSLWFKEFYRNGVRNGMAEYRQLYRREFNIVITNSYSKKICFYKHGIDFGEVIETF